ncbi:twin-arginine translocase TatA/TatE family subunit [Henriciella aquimarina]|uniref:twin-arginine translocase TatA/TatE family subunit n=1 Tax=Henriciella aquimarina TaxID=545261 RepID=UPI000A009BC5|nr:twin-arginine translocase TatA/TatE family subunit [Henriciella aquimarina]
MAPSWMQLLIVLVVALLLFGGRGRISSIMGDMAKGVRSFRQGLNDDDEEEGKDKDKTQSSNKQLDDDKMVNVTPEKDKTKSSS